MSILPHTLDKGQTLYSIIPLVIDIKDINSYMSHIETPYGDCQFFSLQEIPSHTFRFLDKEYQLLQQNNNKPTVPFTVLLVGHSFACKHIMHSYDKWARIHKDSLINTFNLNTNVSYIHNNNTKSNPLTYWTAITHPTVWAQSTFSNTTVTCLYPDLLQNELSRLFDFPIEVTPIAPISSHVHNEFAAWLTAIYSLTAAQNLFRTVICHSYSWAHCLQYFTNHGSSTIPKIPKSWVPLVSNETYFTNNSEKNSHKSINLLKTISRYDIKINTYKYKHKKINISRIIGLGHANHTILNKEEINREIITQKKFQLILKYNTKHAEIIIPLIPSRRVSLALRHIVAKKFKIDFQQVTITYVAHQDHTIAIYDNHYSLLANLILQLCKNSIPQKTTNIKKISLHHGRSSLTKKYASVATAVEFNISRYSKMLSLHRANIVLDIGYISHTSHVTGIIEEAFYSSLFSLCGSNHIIDNDNLFPLSISFIDHKTALHASAFSILTKQSSTNAIINAISTHFPHASFPIRRLA